MRLHRDYIHPLNVNFSEWTEITPLEKISTLSMNELEGGEGEGIATCRLIYNYRLWTKSSEKNCDAVRRY